MTISYTLVVRSEEDFKEETLLNLTRIALHAYDIQVVAAKRLKGPGEYLKPANIKPTGEKQ